MAHLCRTVAERDLVRAGAISHIRMTAIDEYVSHRIDSNGVNDNQTRMYVALVSVCMFIGEWVEYGLSLIHI